MSPTNQYNEATPQTLPDEWLLQHEPQDRYVLAAVGRLPRLIGLLDRNPLSSTYGCFDRSYWHYRTMDFPCGMSQEFVLPLALAYAWQMPGGERYFQQQRVRDWCIAAMHYARKSSHSDGTCDDYFPFERAMGALVFSLYAMTETCLVLDMKEEPEVADSLDLLLEFFVRRGDHLGKENETGQLANHQALAALALYNVYLLTGEERFRKWSDERRDLTLSWQHDEGWFQEYEGADPGYHSCSIDFLGKLRQKSGDDDILLPPLKKAGEFARWFMHPDGSYAGEYGSRNTYHFYPHGFELLAAEGHAASAEIVELFLEKGLPNGSRYYNDDDRMCAHYVYNWMQAWRDFSPKRAINLNDTEIEQEQNKTETKFFPAGGLFVVRKPEYHAVCNLRKGGVIKAIRPDGPWVSDTGPMVKTAGGSVLVSHLMKPADSSVQQVREDDEVGWVAETEARFDYRKTKLANPWTQIAFRLLTLTVGRFNANLVRSTLQKILITGKKPAPLKLKRTLIFGKDAVTITDELTADSGAPQFTEIVHAPDATSIYVANSNTYQQSVVLDNSEMDAQLDELNNSGTVEYSQSFKR
jgi:hypothetical protein